MSFLGDVRDAAGGDYLLVFNFKKTNFLLSFFLKVTDFVCSSVLVCGGLG